MKAAFPRGNVSFLTNPSFWLAESDFLFSGNSIFLFTDFVFLLVETIISSKIDLH